MREGLEAALIIGIVLVSLGKSGSWHLKKFVWSGVGLAIALSLAVGLALEKWQVNEEAFEGVLLLASAVFVVTMIVWMSRASRHLKKDIEKRVESYSQKSQLAAGLGIGAFVFLMVIREGAELALILRAVELSTRGAFVWIGTLLGLGGAVAVGLFFFQGTLKIPLGRFFAVTSWILGIVAFQLGLSGVHELSEGGWLPAGPTEMAFIGPVVRNDVFFFAAILGVAAVLVLRECLALSRTSGGANGGTEGEKGLAREQRRQAAWLMAAATTFVVVMLILTADFIYARVAAAPPEAKTLQTEGGLVRIPLAGLGDGDLHFFRAEVNGANQEFMVLRQMNGQWVAAIAGCMICGRHGYRQDGSNVVCRNCGAVVPMALIGTVGGCNPVAVPSRLENGELVLRAGDLAQSVQVAQ